jgi:hypothetical protein
MDDDQDQDQNPLGATPDQIYARNAPYAAPHALTQLSPGDERNFQKWVGDNHVPFDPSPQADYDMRGFYSALAARDPRAVQSVNQNDNQLHFPDYWKTPYHASFSAESQWAKPGAPSWNDVDQLVLPDGRIVFDERSLAKARQLHRADGEDASTFDLGSALARVGNIPTQKTPELETIDPQPLIPRSLSEEASNRAQNLWNEFKQSRLSGQTATGLGATLDPVAAIPGANAGLAADELRAMYHSRLGTKELPEDYDLYKYYNAENAARDRFASENPETAQTIGAVTEAGLSHPSGMGAIPHNVEPAIENARSFVKENTPGPNQLNIFAGPSAKTANHEALAMAKEMQARGVSPERIYKGTRWWQGDDGKWRFEIPDDTSSMYVSKEGEKPLSDTLHHPKLYEAYPDVANIPTYTGRFHPDQGGAYDTEMDKIYLNSNTPFNQRSALLHEIQHAIQQREGFTPGGSPNRFTPEEIAAERRRLQETYSGDNGWTSVGTMPGDVTDKQIAHQLYTKIPGEIEARDVQSRMRMSPDERSDLFPSSHRKLRKPELPNFGGLSDEALGLLNNQRKHGGSISDKTYALLHRIKRQDGGAAPGKGSFQAPSRLSILKDVYPELVPPSGNFIPKEGLKPDDPNLGSFRALGSSFTYNVPPDARESSNIEDRRFTHPSLPTSDMGNYILPRTGGLELSPPPVPPSSAAGVQGMSGTQSGPSVTRSPWTAAMDPGPFETQVVSSAIKREDGGPVQTPDIPTIDPAPLIPSAPQDSVGARINRGEITPGQAVREGLDQSLRGLSNLAPKSNEQAAQIALDAIPIVGNVRSAQAGYDAYNKGDWLGTALGAIGSVPVLGGMFFPATRAQIAKAAAMEAQGLHPDTILRQTGAHRNVEGDWTREVSDANSRVIPDRETLMGEEGAGGPAKTMFDHPELYKQAPGLGKYHLEYEQTPEWITAEHPNYVPSYQAAAEQWEKTGASPKEILENLGMRRNPNEEWAQRSLQQGNHWGDEKIISATGGNPEDLRSTTLHEFQHAVDKAAGRGAGANSNMIYRSLTQLPPEEVVKVGQEAHDLGSKSAPNLANYNEDWDGYLRHLADDLYRRDVGEARARATEARRNLSDTQRLNRHPRRDMDVPPEQQIIRPPKKHGGSVSAPPFKRGGVVSDATWRLLAQLKNRA